jgi:hypothetical protein
MGPLTYKVFNLHRSKQCETFHSHLSQHERLLPSTRSIYAPSPFEHYWAESNCENLYHGSFNKITQKRATKGKARYCSIPTVLLFPYIEAKEHPCLSVK